MSKTAFLRVCGKDIKVAGRFIRVAGLDGEKYVFPDDPQAMCEGLRMTGARIDLFTFLQRLPDTAPKYPYHLEWDNLAVLPVSTFDQWWNHQLRTYPRNRARQAEKKGVVLKEVAYGEALLEGICKIYNESPIRQGKRFPHFGMTLEHAREYAGTFPDRSIWIGAFIGEQMIGFVKLVVDETRTQACIVHILSMLRHKDKAPTNALIAQAVKSCADRAIPHLVYENFCYGNKQGDNLSHFKEVNGFRRVDLPRYYMPLTSLGALALRLSLHRKIVDHFPEPLLAKLRNLRTSWYGRKFRPVKEAS
jgi:hypothetical protein